MIVILGIAFAVIVLVTIFWMLLSHRLREKYAVLWLIVGFAMLILTIFPDLLVALSRALGVQIPSNLLFIGALALLVGVTLHQSWELSAAEGETRRVAEEVAILRAEIDLIKGPMSGRDEDRHETDATES